MLWKRMEGNIKVEWKSIAFALLKIKLVSEVMNRKIWRYDFQKSFFNNRDVYYFSELVISKRIYIFEFFETWISQLILFILIIFLRNVSIRKILFLHINFKK